MLSKFETKSSRVKGLSLHPSRPWVLASLHNGSIQLWDYKMGTLVERWDEHEGPVRGIAFHPTHPTFVSGGDDYKIKLWNYKSRRCLFTLTGHLDYIRSVGFHSEMPWIISASDDQTIRIWNWQSRTCISILTGHNHYVMCAHFHPKDDLIVSASLDQTVRVWDISGLKKKHSAGSTYPSTAAANQNDMFATDCVVKYVLEGHDRGVNWVSFHPTLPLIVSGADDRQVKIWRMSDTKAWEVDTLRGHYNNVSCALFHPRQELIISNSEDKTIRVWDIQKRSVISTFRREHDRFWILAAHPEAALFAAGHDSGLIVFKLERERPASAIHQNQLYYIKDKVVRMIDLATGTDVAMLSIRKSTAATGPLRTLSYNPAEHAVIVTLNNDGGSYEYYSLPRDVSPHEVGAREADNVKKGNGSAAVFLARNRFAVLDKGQDSVLIKDTHNEVTKVIKLPSGLNVVDMHYAGMKSLLLTTPNSVMLYDTELRTSTAELAASNVRYVSWSPDMSLVALMSKHTIIIANKKLEQLCMIHETIKVKSGAWDEIGVFVYTTLNHLKFALPSGDSGIIKTLESPLYVVKVRNNSVFAIDRESRPRLIQIDATEYRFKLCLLKRNYDEVLNIIKNSNLVGQSIIAYLQKKGYPEVALHFVKDPKTRFDLAVECGNMEVALEMAKVIDKEVTWQDLASEAMKLGHYKTVEMCLQRIKNFDRLSFLYLASGSTDKLKKMMKIAELRNDPMSQFHNAMFLGDIEEQVKVLKSVGQLPLAYLMAKTHGLNEEAASILESAGIPLDKAPPTLPRARLLKPPTPLQRDEADWPQLEVSRSFFEAALLGQANNSDYAGRLDEQAMRDTSAGEWAQADDTFDPNARQAAHQDFVEAPENIEGGGWDLDADLDLGSMTLNDGAAEVGGLAGADMDGFGGEIPAPLMNTGVVPAKGPEVGDVWIRGSSCVGDHVAAGHFESAMQLLSRQAGVVNFAPLKPLFMQIYLSSKAYLSINPNLPPVTFPLHRSFPAGSMESGKPTLQPYLALNLGYCTSLMNEALNHFTQGRLAEAIDGFRSVVLAAALVVVQSQQESEQINEMINISREYLVGLRLETERRKLNLEVATEAKRSAEMAAYFTHCQIQPRHLALILRSAMSVCFKLRNFNSALSFARRLLETNPPPQIAQQIRTIQQRCEASPVDAMQLDYDQYNPFTICAKTYTPIYRGSPTCSCPYCHATFKADFNGSVCSVCEIARLGESATGLRNVRERQ